MTEWAARLVDGILPHVPVRQFVPATTRAAPRPSRRPLGLRDGGAS